MMTETGHKGHRDLEEEEETKEMKKEIGFQKAMLDLLNWSHICLPFS